jgi:hypothetical protein
VVRFRVRGEGGVLLLHRCVDVHAAVLRVLAVGVRMLSFKISSVPFPPILSQGEPGTKDFSPQKYW